MRTVYEFSVKDRKGKEVSLKEYANEVLLIVNTATKCGFTPTYDQLEALYEKYHAKGFEVLDFPCNQFGQQAPGTDESIHEFCKLNYGTEFPRFKKVKVNGDDADPLFKFLKEQRVSLVGMNHMNSTLSLTKCFQKLILIIRKKRILNGISLSSLLIRKDKSLHALNQQRRLRILLSR